MSYNYFNFLFYFLFFNSFVQAQITSISGNLIDSNKEPLAFINALVYHSNGNYIGVGALSDQNGFFLIKDIPKLGPKGRVRRFSFVFTSFGVEI